MTKPHIRRPLLRSQELALHLGVRPETIGRWVKEGVIPAIRIREKTLRFDLDAVLAALSTTPAKGVARGR